MPMCVLCLEFWEGALETPYPTRNRPNFAHKMRTKRAQNRDADGPFWMGNSLLYTKKKKKLPVLGLLD